MNRKLFFTRFALCAFVIVRAQSYNQLWIPDTLSGTVFNLTAKDTFKQIVSGNQTITGGFNSNFWGPTLFVNKGDVVHMNIKNELQDTTTVHWHGMHLPAIMDGGPHQKIAPNTTWSPYWKVSNHAATYWYHPHLDMMAQKQITEGLGGFLIVRDSNERSLNLPRTYGIDDIPLAITDRDIDHGTKQFVEVPYGDSIMVNGTLRPQYTVPSQIVRFRILDAAIETSYNLGFSDNRSFTVITTDGGLLNSPVTISGTAPRFLISAGERVEILVNFSGQSGNSVFLKAYNSTLPQNVPGGDFFPGGPFVSYLGKQDYNILKLNVGPQTSNAVINVPSTLANNVYYVASQASYTRTVTISDSTGVTTPPILGPNAFIINHKLFDINYINYTVPLDNIEIWEIKSTSGFSHPFHIHDVEFNILTRNGVAPAAYEQGWKDVVLVKSNETVRFIAKFDDYADVLKPYMFHCHIAMHEDEGMMGQFVVGQAPTGITDIQKNKNMVIYPNPTSGVIHFEMSNQVIISKIEVISTHGQTLMETKNEAQNKVDISGLTTGMYFLKLTDDKGVSYIKSYYKE